MNDNTKTISSDEAIQELLDRAFEEDVKTGDVTTNAIVDEDARAEAVWIAKEEGIVAGLDIARKVFHRLDPQLVWETPYDDGEKVKAGEEIAKFEGSCRAILTAERIALNIAQRTCGIATVTRQYVEAIEDFETKILDTRKTVPGLRRLDKFGVAAGGGTNHRMGLFDLVMVKDNHIIAAGSIGDAVLKVRGANPDLRVEVETTTLDQVEEALQAGADIIMLDNMSIRQMKKAVSLIKGQAETEASGNISLENVREVAQTGVDFISVGALTHSVKAFDISQEIQNIFK